MDISKSFGEKSRLSVWTGQLRRIQSEGKEMEIKILQWLEQAKHRQLQS